MRRTLRPIVAALALALAGTVAGCTSFDPSDMLDFLDTKKKLPGERRPVFPNGVPGIEEGIPREYMQGDSAAPAAGQPQTPNAAVSPQAGAPPPSGEAAAEETPPPAVKPPKGTKVAARRRITAIPKDGDTPPASQSRQAAPQSQAAQPQSQSAFPAPLPGTLQ